MDLLLMVKMLPFNCYNGEEVGICSLAISSSVSAARD